MSSRVIKHFQCFKTSQYFQIFEYFIQVSELVIIDDKSFYVFKDIENSIDILYLVMLHKQVFDSKVTFKTLQWSKCIVVEPEYLQIRKILEIDQYCRFFFT